jgi:hypothetical protein
MDPAAIESLVRQGASYLAAALWEYWPVNGNNEVGERNISLHVGRSLSDAGFHCYAEAHSGQSTSQRIDLVAYHPSASTILVGESKRLYSMEKLTEMLNDVERVLSFEPVAPLARPKRSFGLLMATTWDPNVASWWSSADGDWPGADALCDSFGWKNPQHKRAWERGRFGSVVLRGYVAGLPSNQKFHHFLYCILEAPQK